MGNDEERLARRVVVRGRVQGVFFRDSCRQKASEAGVDGWVRNAPDGAVEAWFEGPATSVDELVRWCKEGPSRADVDDVSVSDEAPTGEAGFRVR